MKLNLKQRKDFGGASRAAVPAIAVLALAGLAVWWHFRSQPPQTTSEPRTVEAGRLVEISKAPPQNDPQPATAKPESENAGPVAVLRPAPAVAAAAPDFPRTEPTPLTRQLVESLSKLDLTHGPLTAEQAVAWKQTLKQLTDQGQAAVPAIREFLEKNLDLNFDAAGNERLVGATSLRLALFDALHDLGGPEAIGTLAQTLQATADPAELATLAKLLEKSDPEKYRAAILSAARDTLNLAATSQWDGREVSPLFEILKHYGGAADGAELEKFANTWFDYTPLTLAQMPDGAGVPSLIKLAQNADGAVTLGHEIYERMLAQVAVEHPEAADALVEQTRANRIEVSAWPGVAEALTGSTLHLAKPLLDPPAPVVAPPVTRMYHVSAGNQNFIETSPPAGMTANQIGDRIRLIDTLLGATSNPAAIDALEGARTTLAARQSSAK